MWKSKGFLPELFKLDTLQKRIVLVLGIFMCLSLLRIRLLLMLMLYHFSSLD